jgi:hypothetical protein
MSDDRLLNAFIIEQELLKDTNLLLKKKESLNKLLILSLNETNDHLNKLFLNIIQRQNRLFNYLYEENDRCIQRQTLENHLNKILFNENILIDQLKRIYLKLNIKKRRRIKTFISRNTSKQINNSVNHSFINQNDQHSFQYQLNTSNDDILTIYCRSISSNNLSKRSRIINMRKSSSSTFLDNTTNKYSLFNHYLTNIHCYFPKLEKINRTHLTRTISQTNSKSLH